jgi:hypothetical protein
MREALVLASFVHQLTVIDNEAAIKTGEIHAEMLRTHADNQRDTALRRNSLIQRRIGELLEEHQDWSNKRVALAIPESDRRNLEIDTVRKMVAKVRKNTRH